MKIKNFKSFTACIEQTARLLRKEAAKFGSREIGPPPDLPLANKIGKIAQLLRKNK